MTDSCALYKEYHEAIIRATEPRYWAVFLEFKRAAALRALESPSLTRLPSWRSLFPLRRGQTKQLLKSSSKHTNYK